MEGGGELVVLKVFIYEMKRIECVSVSQDFGAPPSPTHPLILAQTKTGQPQPSKEKETRF